MDWWGASLYWHGEKGDQDINWSQNATLAACENNGVDVHLFEVIDAGEYIYCGRIELVDKPYVDIQPDEDGNDRSVWMFPIRPVPDNDVRKPSMFVFKDMEDYEVRGKNVDAEYIKMLAEQRRKDKDTDEKPMSSQVASVIPPTHVVPPEIVGKRVKHRSYGEGTITGIDGVIISAVFDSVGEKKLIYDVCMKNRLIELI